MSRLEQIIAKGNRTLDPEKLRHPVQPSQVTCRDGFTLSVIAGEGAYCSPRPNRYAMKGDTHSVSSDFPGPYTAVEVGFPSARPEPWDQWSTYSDGGDDPTESVYGYVPVAMVRALVESHGGEA